MTIREATAAEAPYISSAICQAVGEGICLEFANGHGPKAVAHFFEDMARRDGDTQYSFRNALVAVDADGRVMGVAVGYDGARLDALRPAFFTGARRLGHQYDEASFGRETSDDEFYLDTICVFSRYRRRGVGRALIEAMARRAADAGKPLGLLVDKENIRAQRLYKACGFCLVDERPFAGEMMYHLQRQ